MAAGILWAVVAAVVGILVLAAVVVLIVLLYKKNRGVQENADSETEGVQGRGDAVWEGRKAVLRGTGGQFAGRTFLLEGTGLMIGKDRDHCQVVFSSEAQGVDERHCRLSYRASTRRFTLTDLGTASGTFIGVGERLAKDQSVELSDGSRFYLGTPANSFIVELE